MIPLLSQATQHWQYLSRSTLLPYLDFVIPALLVYHSHLTVSVEEVAHAIRSFPNGSAGGPNSFRPQHLKDMTAAAAEEGGSVLFIALTDLSKHILKGNCPTSICPFFFGATLIALKKREGGIRPIAVGCTLHRLASKVASRHVSDSMGSFLCPYQLGLASFMGQRLWFMLWNLTMSLSRTRCWELWRS